MEFAFILPIFVMFILGIVEFGRGYNARIELTSAVREGARAVALFAPTDSAGAISAGKTATINGAPGLKPALTPAQVTVVPCPTVPTVNTNAMVDAAYPFTYTIPFVGTRSSTLTARGVFRCGG